MDCEQLIAYFNEHIIYEYDMLRGTSVSIDKAFSAIFRNALIESYGVHARNLRAFLTNEKGKGNNSIVANMYNQKYKANKPPDLNGIFQKLNSSINHLGKDRSNGKNAKFDSENIQKTICWIEREFCQFLEELPEPYKSKIDTIKNIDDLLSVGIVSNYSEPSATNAIQSTTVISTKSDSQ